MFLVEPSLLEKDAISLGAQITTKGHGSPSWYGLLENCCEWGNRLVSQVYERLQWRENSKSLVVACLLRDQLVDLFRYGVRHVGLKEEHNSILTRPFALWTV